jgi:hypothetical protein
MNFLGEVKTLVMESIEYGSFDKESRAVCAEKSRWGSRTLNETAAV